MSRVTEAQEEKLEELGNRLQKMDSAVLGELIKEGMDNTNHMGWEAAGYTAEMAQGVWSFLRIEVSG